MEALWPIITVVGPILFLLVAAWAVMKTRANRRADATADQGARKVYAEDERNSHG